MDILLVLGIPSAVAVWYWQRSMLLALLGLLAPTFLLYTLIMVLYFFVPLMRGG